MIVIYLSKFCCILIIVCVIFMVDYCELQAISILYQWLNLLFINHLLLIDVCLILSEVLRSFCCLVWSCCS
jgi:hypothetical protein